MVDVSLDPAREEVIALLLRHIPGSTREQIIDCLGTPPPGMGHISFNVARYYHKYVKFQEIKNPHPGNYGGITLCQENKKIE